MGGSIINSIGRGHRKSKKLGYSGRILLGTGEYSNVCGLFFLSYFFLLVSPVLLTKGANSLSPTLITHLTVSNRVAYVFHFYEHLKFVFESFQAGSPTLSLSTTKIFHVKIRFFESSEKPPKPRIDH